MSEMIFFCFEKDSHKEACAPWILIDGSSYYHHCSDDFQSCSETLMRRQSDENTANPLS